MNDDVGGERQFARHHRGGQRALRREGAVIAGDAVGGSGRAVLDRNLHMIEPGFDKRVEAFCG